MPKVGVVLSGCGVFDGAEIHESVLTLLALCKQGAEVVFMAPNVDQHHVVNHLTQEEMKENRNVLVESARIARGNIKDIKEVNSADIDALIFPGGYGAAKNLCSFAFEGPDCKVQPDVAKLAQEVHVAKKPIGVICIAPALAAKIFEGQSVKLTIGNDAGTAEAINKMGQTHTECPVKEVCVDQEKRIVSTPAYMLANDISEAAAGIERLVSEVLGMLK